MVLDGHDRRAVRARQLLPHPLLEAGHLQQVARAAGGAAEAPRVRQREPGLLPQVGARLPRHRHGVDAGAVAGVELAGGPAQRRRREAGPMLDAAEALFLDAGDEAAVGHRGGRGVGVVGGEAEDA